MDKFTKDIQEKMNNVTYKYAADLQKTMKELQQIANRMKNDNVSDDLVLNYFVGDQERAKNTLFMISFKDYLKRDPEREKNSDYVIFDGHLALIRHIIRGQRFYGNSKLIRCDPKEIKKPSKYNRLIRINSDFIFNRSMLFVRYGDEIFRLKDDFGFLQLRIPTRDRISIIEPKMILANN